LGRGEQTGQLKIAQLQTFLRKRTRGIIGQAPQVQTAVMVPLVRGADGSLSVLFTKRAMSLRRQPGEISFPGGHREPADRTDRDTALRETSEELGISIDQIEYIGPLDVLVAWSGLLVYPHVGVVPGVDALHPNPQEVGEVFAVPIDQLLAMQPKVYDVALRPMPPDDFPYEWIPNGRNYRWRTTKVLQYFYPVGGHIIWGLTARILTHFLDIVRTQDRPQTP
jgi:coenzyme A diphosphatase NUDT7